MPDDYCGPCYGANIDGVANPCCNTCEEVQRAYTDMGWSADADSFEQVFVSSSSQMICY